MNTGIKLYRLHQKLNYQYCLVLFPFRLFYSLNDDGKTPKNIEGSINKEIPDYVIELLRSFADGYNIYLGKYKLMNPLKLGIYYEKGAKFIDVMIENIPIQKGLVAAELVNNSALFGIEESMRGSAIKILLDRNLIKNSATPIHELFHVFQYNYCSFNNMWFMEGLARWGQNITHERQERPEKLPSNREELEALVQRAHDAEYFWRRLISLSQIKEELFIKNLLEHSTCQALKLEEKYFFQNRYKPNNWSKEEKKSALNNKYIFSAILDTIGEPFPHANNELKIFVNLLLQNSAPKTDNFNTPQIQRFLKVLQLCDKELVYEKDGIYYCDYYDIETKTLNIKTLECLDMSEYDLDSFNLLHHIQGELLISSQAIEALNGFNYLKSVDTLSIMGMDNLSTINGFNALETLNALEISSNKNLVHIHGFNSLFKSNAVVKKSIKIIKNAKLQSIDFLQGLQSVKSSFYLHQNALINLKGLEELTSVGASFSLSSNKLQDISALSKLESIDGMLGLGHNELSSLTGLENLKRLKMIKWNGEDRILSIHANPKLHDISAIQTVLELYKKEINILLPTSGETQNDVFIKHKILFGDKWQNVLSKCDWLDAHHKNFKNANEIVAYCKSNQIEILFANNFKTQLFILINERILKNAGLKYIINSADALKNFVNKQKFYDLMLQNNLSAYVPKYYENIEDVQFPCMVKTKTGGAGRGVYLAYNKEEINTIDKDIILSEYLKSNVEYATTIFYNNGKLLKDITYSKTALKDTYVLQQESKDTIKVQREETQFLELFVKIVEIFSGRDGYCACSINYKIENDIPKIFEINPRMGYTLAGFCGDFKEMMDVYVKELENV